MWVSNKRASGKYQKLQESQYSPKMLRFYIFCIFFFFCLFSLRELFTWVICLTYFFLKSSIFQKAKKNFSLIRISKIVRYPIRACVRENYRKKGAWYHGYWILYSIWIERATGLWWTRYIYTGLSGETFKGRWGQHFSF